MSSEQGWSHYNQTAQGLYKYLNEAASFIIDQPTAFSLPDQPPDPYPLPQGHLLQWLQKEVLGVLAWVCIWQQLKVPQLDIPVNTMQVMASQNLGRVSATIDKPYSGIEPYDAGIKSCWQS